MVYVCSIMSSPIGCSSPGSSVHGTLQARTLVVLSLSKTLKILFPWAPKSLQMVTEAATKNTGVGCYFLLQGIFPTQGSNPHLLCLLHWQVNSLLLSHQGSPKHSLGAWKNTQRPRGEARTPQRRNNSPPQFSTIFSRPPPPLHFPRMLCLFL